MRTKVFSSHMSFFLIVVEDDMVRANADCIRSCCYLVYLILHFYQLQILALRLALNLLFINFYSASIDNANNFVRSTKLSTKIYSRVV